MNANDLLPRVQNRVATPLGPVHLAASAHGLAGLWFEGQRHLPARLSGPDAWPVDAHHPVLRAAAAQLNDYLDGRRGHFDLPLDLGTGTAFQQSVWHALLGIARGDTSSYGALARQLGRPTAVRAVASAIGRNPLSVVVPCHRVLGARGALTGYAGGLQRKRALLRLEGALAPAPPAIS
ncbi:methylated-DNA-[protein]-cysteine S-methyltransferase [Oryzisolibacter propanilivorax]|uniref:Methylated-DNA--protein-cysteine methyltransferase n=1 Tax=Oryzisolibacter propanilivorax TaxID=1527607 RepID=A0A1G9PLJ6_9BURK|nr:methylated-DNA--[protein]-cysteine S-methyltransferase [Oryzisolibacter propanilivorax]SDL98955.1 methylated-DNA-[protein]-cysteine S-methyltransferase [Oryzisolibacter propanilivorax]